MLQDRYTADVLDRWNFEARHPLIAGTARIVIRHVNRCAKAWRRMHQEDAVGV